MGSLIDDETLLARAYLSRVAEPASIWLGLTRSTGSQMTSSAPLVSRSC